LNPYARRAALLAEADQLRNKLRDSQLAVFRSEAKNRKEVLRKLGHINDEGGLLWCNRVSGATGSPRWIDQSLLQRAIFSRMCYAERIVILKDVSVG